MSCIILEGTEGVGKTAVFNRLAQLIPLCETVKLSGGPKGCGPDYQRAKFQFWARYALIANQNTLLLDRGPTSERVYGPLKGYKASDLDYLGEVEAKLNESNSHLILLTASRGTLMSRLAKKREQNPNEHHATLDTIYQVQQHYLDVLHQTNRIRNAVVVDTTKSSVEEVAQAILRVVRPAIHRRGVGL